MRSSPAVCYRGISLLMAIPFMKIICFEDSCDQFYSGTALGFIFSQSLLLPSSTQELGLFRNRGRLTPESRGISQVFTILMKLRPSEGRCRRVRICTAVPLKK